MKKRITLFLLCFYFISPIILNAQNACCEENVNNQPPILNCDNLDIAITCNQNLEVLKKPTFSDDCTPTDLITLTYVDDNSNVNDCGQGGFILRTWTATDACGLTATCVQTIAIINNGLVNNCQLALTLFKCEKSTDIRDKLAEWNQQNIDFLHRCANFGCDNPVSVTSNFDLNFIEADCETTPEQFVTYTIEDNCGRTVFKFGKYTIQKLFDPICDSIKIQITDNQIVISNLIAPNNIIKIFDKDYGLAFECVGDCGQSVTIPNLNEGEVYFADIQAYEENWSFICERKEEIMINGESEPCDPTVCQGDVTLNTQAEVDAFCSCEVIEGDLLIGYIPEGSGAISDISNIQNLEKLKQVDGNVTIGFTHLTDLNGLSALEKVGGLIFFSNLLLENLDALNKLTEIELALIFSNHPKLTTLNGLNNLHTVSIIRISETAIVNLDALANLTVTSLIDLDITGCDDLISLSSLAQITEYKSVGGVDIIGNTSLKSLDFLKACQLIDGPLTIVDNPNLSGCCALTHLIDNNPNNGIITGNITLLANPNLCNSVESILASCQEIAATCDNIQINTQNNQIVISNLTAPNEIIKVFDQNYNIVYQCNANCEDTQMAGTFPLGNYIVDLQLYDENWQLICAEQRNIALENSNPCSTNPCETVPPVLANIPADVTVECDDIPIEPLNITATDNCDSSVSIEFDERRTDGSCVDNYTLTRTWTAMDDCGNTAKGRQTLTIIDSTPPVLANIPADITVSDISQLPDGLSLFVTATDNCDADVEITFNEENVNETTTIRTWTATDNCGNTASGIQTISITNDGFICPNTVLESFDNQLTIKNINAPNSIVKVFDNDWQLILQCQNDCDPTLVFDNLQIGDIYHLDAQFYDENWQLICAIKEDKRIGSDTEPCPDPICLGSIELNTQVEVDNFCGCERIEGQLTIGSSDRVGDVTDLSNLSDLQEIGGSLVIRQTRLTNLAGLSNLEKMSSINFFENPDLTSLNGLDRLQTVEFGIFIINSPILTDLSALSPIKSLEVLRMDNVGVRDLTAFSNIENKSIGNLFLLNCARLESLQGSKWNQISGIQNPGILNITNNNLLTDIDALENVKLIKGTLIIRDNNKLTDCCPITHLIDADTENGQVEDAIIIERNPINCRSAAAVLEVCAEEDPNENCDAIQVSTTANQLKISNILAVNATIKVYDNAYQLIFQCSGDCGDEVIVDALNPSAIYNLDIQLYDGNWQSLCNFTESVTLGAQGRSNDLQPIDFSISPNPAQSEVFIDLKRLKGEKVTLQLHNQFGQIVRIQQVEKVTDLPEKMDLTDISNGLYFLQIQVKGRRTVGKKLLINKLY